MALSKGNIFEKDGAVSFLVQLKDVQIDIQCESQQIASQKQVSIHFDDEQHIKTEHGEAQPVQTEDTVPSRGKLVTPATVLQQQDSKEIKIEHDDNEDNSSAAWMTERDDGNDDTQTPYTAQVVERGCPSATRLPREEHPCPDCHVILNSTWDLDLHKLHDCTEPKNSIQHVYNCDQCWKSFRRKAKIVAHLRKDHNNNMTASEMVEKLEELKSTKRQKKENKDEKCLPSDTKALRHPGLGEARGQTTREKVARRKKRDIRDMQKLKEQKKQVGEKGEENLNVMRDVELVLENRERDTSVTMPMSESEISEAELEEENGNALAISETDEGQGHAAEGAEENQDASTDHHMGKKRKRQTADLKVHESQEGTCEPSEMIEQKAIHETAEKRTKEESNLDVGDSEYDFTTSKKSTENGEDAIVCFLCDLQFETKCDRRKHMRKSHKEYRQQYKCSTCGKICEQKGVYITHVETHKDKTERQKYYCKICDKTYLSKYYYVRHMKSHHDKSKLIECETCGKTLTSKRRLERHMNDMHIKEIKYICDLCGKRFYTNSEIKFHQESHNIESAFKCEECGKSFLMDYQLKVHKKRVHSNAGHCHCEVCGSAFKSQANLKQHNLTVHSGVYRYHCDLCGKKFKRTSHQIAHMKIHSKDPANKPFKCELCSKAFQARGMLKVHMDWHNNIRSHKCDVCGKSFLRKGNLDKHQYVHQDKKPHECQICSHGFIDLPVLRKHLDVIHNITLKKVVMQRVRKANDSN